MTTKLKIDLSEGILEVEGSEAFVKALYNDFKAHFLGEEAVDDLFRPTRNKRVKTIKTPTKVSKSEPVLPSPEQTPPSKTPTVEPIIEVAKPVTPQPKPETPASKPKPKPKPKPGYKFLEKLDLSATKDKPSLTEFMDAKLPITNEERNLVFLHYLQHIRKIKAITIDHVYTCYRAAKIRVPINIEKSLYMAANWINMSKIGRLTVSAAGKRYVEKQLHKKIKG